MSAKLPSDTADADAVPSADDRLRGASVPDTTAEATAVANTGVRLTAGKVPAATAEPEAVPLGLVRLTGDSAPDPEPSAPPPDSRASSRDMGYTRSFKFSEAETAAPAPAAASNGP